MNKKILIGLIGTVVFWSCEKLEPIADNPLDPDNPNYVPPTVTITSGPSDGEIVDTSSVTFEWIGNVFVTSYRYKFIKQNWSHWSTSRSTTFNYLNERVHNFSVQSRYITGDTSLVVTVDFTVNAVQGLALMFYPRRHIASVGDTVTFQILAEEVENLTSAEFTISFDPSYLAITSISQGAIFMGNGESIFHTENGSGTLSILTALLGGENPSVSGTGNLVTIEVSVLQTGETQLTFDGSEVFRDPDNNPIYINDTVNGLAVVE